MLGKTVFITGGCRGIGAAIANQLLLQGANVIVTTRHPTESILDNGALVLTLDVSDNVQVSRCFSEIKERFGKLDALINNAGYGVFKLLDDISFNEWQQVINTNLTGVFLCSQAAVKLMPEGGRIVNISSIADHRGIVENTAYAASKFAVRGFSQCFNEEFNSRNIPMTTVSFGAVDTGIWDEREGFSPDDMLRPEEAADIVVDVLRKPLSVRIDELKAFPLKGLL